MHVCAMNLKTTISSFLFSLLHIATQAMTRAKMRVETEALRTCLWTEGTKTKMITMTTTILRKLTRRMALRQSGWKLLMWVLPHSQCGLIFTTSLSCCCLLVKVDILETCLFNLQKDFKKYMKHSLPTRHQNCCVLFRILKPNVIWKLELCCVSMHVYLVDEGGLSLLLRRVRPSSVISFAFPAYLIMHDKRVSCLFSEISTLCSVAMEQSYLSLMENFMGCLIVAVYCYFLIFFYTVVYTFLSVCVCLPFSLYPTI